MRFSGDIFDAGRENIRERVCQELARSLLERFPEQLRDWNLEDLTSFVIWRSRKAEEMGLTSKADAHAFIETTLLIAPSLEHAKQFKTAIASAPNPSLRMLHSMGAMPPGLMADLSVSNAPRVWKEYTLRNGLT